MGKDKAAQSIHAAAVDLTGMRTSDGRCGFGGATPPPFARLSS
jgi:hypothetical protein